MTALSEAFATLMGRALETRFKNSQGPDPWKAPDLLSVQARSGPLRNTVKNLTRLKLVSIRLFNIKKTEVKSEREKPQPHQ